METQYLIKGMIVGFSIAAPVGPIGLLCIRRSLNQDSLSGLLTGLGAAAADACYGCIAGFGLTAAASAPFIRQKFWLQLVGGVFLCALGCAHFRRHPAKTDVARQAGGRAAAFLSAFLLTLANPATLLMFAAVFAGLGIAGSGGGHAAAAALVLGVFSGSALWWITLTGTVCRVKRSVSPALHRWIGRLSGAALLGFGLAELVELIVDHIPFSIP